MKLNGESMSQARINNIQKTDGKTVFDLNKQYKIAVFEGGGAKGLAYPGAMNALDELNILNGIDCFAGSSAGAITATLLALGLRGEKLEKAVNDIDMKSLLDRPIPDTGHFREVYAGVDRLGGRTRTRGNVEGEYYLNTGNNMLMTARRVVKDRFEECYEEANDDIKRKMEEAGILHHMNINRITFADLEYMKVLLPEKHFADLVITGTQLSGHSSFIEGQNYFSAINSPHMEIAEAIRISTSIPYIFKREKYLGKYYTDGAMTYNLPLPYFIDNDNYTGDILALEFRKKTKDHSKVKEDFRKKALQKIGSKVSSADAAKHNHYEYEVKINSKERRGVKVIALPYGQLNTLSFSAKKEVIQEARDLQRNEILNELNISKSHEEKIEFEKYTVEELSATLEELEKNPKKLVFFIDGKEIKSKNHKKNLLVEMKANLKNRIFDLKNPDPLQRAIRDEEALIHSRKELAKKQQQLAEDIKSDNFDWLYEQIDALIKENQNNSFLSKWLLDLKNHASVMDIALARGIVLVDDVILNSKAENCRDTNEIEKIREEYKQSTVILDALSRNIAEHYGFANESQMRDAMGEIEKENHLEEHRKYFEKHPPKNLRDILSSPYVIHDILDMRRLDDLSLIGYDQDSTHRSRLVSKLKNEIEEGDIRWLSDLLACSRLYKHIKDKGSEEYSAYIEACYASVFGNLPATENEWKKHYSAVVKLFTNPKLTNPDSILSGYFGLIDTILTDFSDEVTHYLESLQHDLKLETGDIPLFSIDDSRDDFANEVIYQRNEFNKENPKGQKITSSFRQVNPDDFDPRIYTEWAASTSTSVRKDQLTALCTYINTNPYTWYNDIFGMNSFFEYRENPLIKLISNPKISREVATGLVARLEELHDKQIYETRTDLNQQLSNQKLTEKSISDGIKHIFNAIKDEYLFQTDHDNLQGITSIEIKPDEISKQGWSQYFPDNLEHGLTINIFRNNEAKKLPPLQQMIEGKIHALCNSAILSANNVNKIKNTILSDFHVQIDSMKVKSKNLEKNTLDSLLEHYTTLTLHLLYENRKDQNLSRKRLYKTVLKEAKYHRSSNHDILNFDLEENTFSYEHPVAYTTTSRNSIVGNPVANLGISFDGSYNEDGTEFKISTSLAHHASLSALETKGISDLQIIIDTCNHIEEIAITLGKLQVFAREEQPRAVDVNWCYQLLSSNIGNKSDELKSYLRISQAIGLMDNFNTMYDDRTNIHLKLSMMNAGISESDDWDEYFRGKGRQNRKAYLHLTDALRHLKIPESLATNKKIVNLQGFLAMPIETSGEYEDLKLRIKSNSDKFNKLRKIYNAIYDKDMLDSGQNILALMNKYHAANSRELTEILDSIIGHNIDRKKLNLSIEDCMSDSERLNADLNYYIEMIDTYMAANWNNTCNNPDIIPRILNSITSDPDIINPEDKNYQEKVLYVSTLLFKAYMDKLYYSGEYLHPEKSVLFNAYLSAYQHLTGMMSTLGDKHGNKRTYVVRLALAAITGRNTEDLATPPDYLRSREEYNKLKDAFIKIANSNAALYTTLSDTCAPPKVDEFKALSRKGANSQVLDHLGKFAEKHALHKLKASGVKLTDEVKNQANNILKKLKERPEQLPEPTAAIETIKLSPESASTAVALASLSAIPVKEPGSDPEEMPVKKVFYDDRETYLNNLLKRLYLISKGKEAYSVFEEELINDIPEIHDPVFTNMKNLFNEWINMHPGREEIIGLGRNINGYYDSENEKLIEDCINDFDILAQSLSGMFTGKEESNLANMERALKKVAFITDFESTKKRDAFYEEDRKASPSLLNKALYHKSRLINHWLRDDEINQYIESLNESCKPANVYYSPTDTVQLKAILNKAGDKFPIHIILNDGNNQIKDARNTGSHWTAMKISLEGEKLNVEYVDSMQYGFPLVIAQVLTDFCDQNGLELIVNESCPIRQKSSYECGYLSIYQTIKWLNPNPDLNLPEFDADNYQISMKTLRNHVQTTILERTRWNASQLGSHVHHAFEELDTAFKLKNEFIKDVFTATHQKPEKAVAEPRVRHNSIESKAAAKQALIVTIPDDPIEPPTLESVKDLAAYRQIEQDMKYLELLMDVLQNPDKLDIALLNRKVGTTVEIHTLAEMDEVFKAAGKDLPKTLDLSRSNVDGLKTLWHILNDDLAWKSTARERAILEAAIYEAESTPYVKKIEDAILAGESDTRIYGKEVHASLHTSTLNVNKKLAPWISKHGFLESHKPGEYKLQQGFIDYVNLLKNKYELHMETIQIYLDQAKQVENINTRIITHETLDTININDRIKNSNDYLLVRLRTGLGSREWLLYHLDNNGKIVSRTIKDHPALSKLNAVVGNKTHNTVINMDQAAHASIHTSIAEYFYHQEYSKKTEAINMKARKPVQKIHSSIHDHDKDVKKQAQYIWETQISKRLEIKENVAFVYHANEAESQMLDNSYNHLDQSLSPVFTDKNEQAELFRELALLVEARHCRDQVHFLPLPSTTDNPEDYDNSLQNIAKHAGAGFTVLAFADNNNRISDDHQINKDLHDLINKPVADWKTELTKAYQRGPVGLSLFKNNHLINDMKERINPDENSPQILHTIRKVLDTKDINNEELFKCLVAVCKAHLASKQKPDEKMDLFIRSIAHYDQNLRIWPDIETVDELIIAQQKNDAIDNEIGHAYFRLKKKQSAAEKEMILNIERAIKRGDHAEHQRLFDQVRNFKPALKVQMKLDAFRILIAQILNPADKRVTLATMLNPANQYMRKEVSAVLDTEGKLGNTTLERYPYPLANAQIHSALKYKRGLIAHKDATTKVSMDKLRDRLVFMQPDTILNTIQQSHAQKTGISEELNGVLTGLLNIQNIYRTKGRKKHTNEIIDLITNARTTINDSSKIEDEKIKLIAENVRAAFNRTKVSDIRKSFGLFYDKEAYQYPRLLESFLRKFEPAGIEQKSHAKRKTQGQVG